jgi:hypothetical protein
MKALFPYSARAKRRYPNSTFNRDPDAPQDKRLITSFPILPSTFETALVICLCEPSKISWHRLVQTLGEDQPLSAALSHALNRS